MRLQGTKACEAALAAVEELEDAPRRGCARWPAGPQGSYSAVMVGRQLRPPELRGSLLQPAPRTTASASSALPGLSRTGSPPPGHRTVAAPHPEHSRPTRSPGRRTNERVRSRAPETPSTWLNKA